MLKKMNKIFNNQLLLKFVNVWKLLLNFYNRIIINVKLNYSLVTLLVQFIINRIRITRHIKFLFLIPATQTYWYYDPLLIGVGFLSILFCLVILGFFIYRKYQISYISGPMELGSAFECGYEPFHTPRKIFDIQFITIAIMFMIFDVELLFLLPWCANWEDCGFLGWISVILFITILVLGYIIDILRNVLIWQNMSSFLTWQKVPITYLLGIGVPMVEVTTLELQAKVLYQQITVYDQIFCWIYIFLMLIYFGRNKIIFLSYIIFNTSYWKMPSISDIVFQKCNLFVCSIYYFFCLLFTAFGTAVLYSGLVGLFQTTRKLAAIEPFIFNQYAYVVVAFLVVWFFLRKISIKFIERIGLYIPRLTEDEILRESVFVSFYKMVESLFLGFGFFSLLLWGIYKVLTFGTEHYVGDIIVNGQVIDHIFLTDFAIFWNTYIVPLIELTSKKLFFYTILYSEIQLKLVKIYFVVIGFSSILTFNTIYKYYTTPYIETYKKKKLGIKK
jgi:NADH-quinone oxidoreductase subunit A